MHRLALLEELRRNTQTLCNKYHRNKKELPTRLGNDTHIRGGQFNRLLILPVWFIFNQPGFVAADENSTIAAVARKNVIDSGPEETSGGFRGAAGGPGAAQGRGGAAGGCGGPPDVAGGRPSCNRVTARTNRGATVGAHGGFGSVSLSLSVSLSVCVCADMI